jgi:TolB-like protein
VLVAVLPFQNLSGDPDQDYLADGLTDEIISRLGQLQPARLGVIARMSSMQYRRSAKGVAQIGRELGVAYLIEGSVRQDQDRLKVNVQLIEAGTQALLWAKRYERDLDEIALLHLNPDEAMTRAGAAAHRALELDPQLAEAHCAAGLVRLFHRWDWEGAEASLTRAVELSPGSAEIRGWYGVFLAFMGREADALAELEQARRLDPLSLLINWTMSLPLYFSGRYDEGIARTNQALELDSGVYLAHSGLGSRYEAKGDHAAAVAHFRRATESSDSPEMLALLGRALALSGDRAAALKIRDELRETASSRYVSPYDLALLSDGLGDRGLTIQYLEEAFRTRAEAMIGLRLDPRLKALLAERRVQDLVHQMGLPPPE